jgi:hypothetical protein
MNGSWKMAESAIGLKTFFEFGGRAPPLKVTISTPDFFLTETGINPLCQPSCPVGDFA